MKRGSRRVEALNVQVRVHNNVHQCIDFTHIISTVLQRTAVPDVTAGQTLTSSRAELSYVPV
jgi:hypothetical protein